MRCANNKARSLLLLAQRGVVAMSRTSTLLACLLLLVARLVHLLNLLCFLPLRVPLASLQHQDPHEHKRENGITRGQDPQGVLAPDQLALLRFGRVRLRRIRAIAVHLCRDGAETLDDIGDVDADAAHVQH